MHGFWAPWLAHELRNVGLEVVCLDTRRARAALKMAGRHHGNRSTLRLGIGQRLGEAGDREIRRRRTIDDRRDDTGPQEDE